MHVARLRHIVAVTVTSNERLTMPNGIRTTELWLTVATEIGIVAAALADALPAKWAAVASAASAGAYAVARGLAKTESAQPVVALPVAHVAPATTVTAAAGTLAGTTGAPPATPAA